MASKPRKNRSKSSEPREPRPFDEDDDSVDSCQSHARKDPRDKHQESPFDWDDARTFGFARECDDWDRRGD